MSDYNQTDLGKPDHAQQGNKLGAGQNPPPKPGQQADLPDQTNQQNRSSEKPAKAAVSDVENGLIFQRPGLEGG